jgi:hypothetical protein
MIRAMSVTMLKDAIVRRLMRPLEHFGPVMGLLVCRYQGADRVSYV